MSGAIVCLWAPTDHRLAAFTAALSGLAPARAACRFRRDALRVGRGGRDCTVAEATSLSHEVFGPEAAIEVAVNATLSSGRVVGVELRLWGDVFARTFPGYEPFLAEVRESMSLNETADLVERVCSSPHVLTCAASVSPSWPAPAEGSATYHADGNAARDLALTWLDLRDGCRPIDAAGLSMGDLRARVSAAPTGATVGIATSFAAWGAHYQTGRGAAHTTRPEQAGDAIVSREQILAGLSTPPHALLEALEAAAGPGDDGGSFKVKRLENGAIVLAARADGILWPLWADALSLLGIREAR